MRGLLIISVLTPILCVVLFVFSNSLKSPPKHSIPTPPSITPPDIVPPIGPLPQPKIKPGSQVEWFEFKPLKNLTDASWGELLTDIENHVPKEYGTQYRSSDKDTWAHESTHGIHAYLNNNFGNPNYYCFYPGNNKAAKVKHPKFTIKDVANALPVSLRESRYNLYLVQQTSQFNSRPLYLWDEWISYANGAATGIELVNKGTYKPAKNNICLGVLEFNVYATYVAIVQKKLDPQYDNKQLLEVLAWNLERGMKIYTEGQKLSVYNWDNDKYLNQLRNSNDAAELRKFLIDTYGAEWTKEIFDFK